MLGAVSRSAVNMRRFRGNLNFLIRSVQNSWHPLPSPRAVFIHVPKTAGTSVNAWLCSGLERFNLRSRGLKKYYEPPQEDYFVYLGHLNPDYPIESGLYSSKQFEKSFSFAFVRNPYDRLASLYFHLRRHDNFEASMPEFLIALKNPDLFPSASIRRRAVHMARPMSNWLSPVTWNGPKAIFRIEEVDEALRVLASELEIYKPMPIIGETTRKVEFELQQDSIKVIQEMYAEDFNRFGYSINPLESRILGTRE